MKRINIDLFELQAVLLLAEKRSFRAVAAEVGLSGPALSRLVARAEERMGARLFDRDTRNVALTPQGREFEALARRVLIEVGGAVEEFNAFLAARRGQVTLAGLPSVTTNVLPRLVSRFVAAHPEVEVRIIDGLSDGVFATVLEGRADLGFAAGAIETSGRLAFRSLAEDPFVAVAAARPDGPLAEDRAYGWRELLEHPFVAMAPGTSVRALTEAAVAQVGVELTPRFEVSHLATAGALISEGLGVAALPALTIPIIGGGVASGGLTVRRLIEPTILRRIGVVTARGRTLSPAARAFEAMIEAADFARPRSDGLGLLAK